MQINELSMGTTDCEQNILSQALLKQERGSPSLKAGITWLFLLVISRFLSLFIISFHTRVVASLADTCTNKSASYFRRRKVVKRSNVLNTFNTRVFLSMCLNHSCLLLNVFNSCADINTLFLTYLTLGY